MKEDYEAHAQAHLASIKRDMRKTMEDATVRAVHKVMAEFEAKSDERLMEDWGPGPHECHSLPARELEQPAQPQQEPVAAECKFGREQKWVRCEIAHHNLVQSEPHKWPDYQTRLLYASPPQRTWVGLTDEEWNEITWGNEMYDIIRMVESKLREKNT